MVIDSSYAACINTHVKGSYLKSLPILLPLSGIPGSGHILCPWDTPTWVTTKQKQHIQRQNSKRNILSSTVLVDVERKMAIGSSKTWTYSILFRKKTPALETNVTGIISAQFTHQSVSRKCQLGTQFSLRSTTEVPLKRVFSFCKITPIKQPISEACD